MYRPDGRRHLVGRKAVMGALSLYLDFINLFLILLRSGRPSLSDRNSD